MRSRRPSKLSSWTTLAGVTATVASLTLFSGCDDDASNGGTSGDASTGGDSGEPRLDGGVDSPTSEDDAGQDAARDAPTDGSGDSSTTFSLTTTAFANGAAIPAIHTCTGGGIANQSPPLVWTGAPANAQSFAIVVRDMSLSTADNYHWVIFDLPASTTALSAGVPRTATPATPPEAVGSKQTYWSFGSLYGYGGPCPPVGGGPHTYRFSVYAFTTATIPVPAGTTSASAADATIQAMAVAAASFTGTYER